MVTEVVLPRVGSKQSTARIARWFVEAGAVVEKGQALCEIEAGKKAAVTIAAPASGRLDRPAASAVALPVGKAVGWILTDGESPSPSVPARASGSSEPTGLPPTASISAAAVELPVATVPTPATPVVAAARPVAAGISDDLIRAGYDPAEVRAIPHDMMRKTIAKRLLQSKLTVPHFYLTVDCTLDPLLRLREELNAAAEVVDGKPAYRISVNDFLVKAMAVALGRVPEANVTWSDEALLRHAHADIAVAVAIPGGLMTPVVRHVERKSVRTVSEEIKDMAARAKTRRLRPEEYRGGSTAISNLGMYGIHDFAAIINPPHATILAVGAGEERVVVRDHQPAVATRMTVTLSTDHRAVDGALGARLLAAFKWAIEEPDSALV